MNEPAYSEVLFKLRADNAAQAAEIARLKQGWHICEQSVVAHNRLLRKAEAKARE